MTLAICILLSAVAIICFLGGLNILVKGAMNFLPKNTPPQLILDNLVRFMAGIYFAFSFLLIYSVVNITSLENIIYFFGLIVIFSGLGRLISKVKLGSAGRYFDIIMIFEIVLGATIMLLQWLR